MNIKGIDGSLGVYQEQLNRANQAGARRVADANDAKTPASATGQNQPAKDTISVSFDGVLRTTAYSTAMSTGDVRQEKVDAIRESLDNGVYAIDSRKIATKLVQDERAIFGK
jgi:flagellar biosynthesis anti-sigma factor FlgM